MTTQTTQEEFVLEERTATRGQVDAVIALLRGKGWVSADKLVWLTTFTKRKLRSIAEASEGLIVSSNEGYAFIHDVPHSDAISTVMRLQRQAQKMQQRAAKILAILDHASPAPDSFIFRS